MASVETDRFIEQLDSLERVGFNLLGEMAKGSEDWVTRDQGWKEAPPARLEAITDGYLAWVDDIKKLLWAAPSDIRDLPSINSVGSNYYTPSKKGLIIEDYLNEIVDAIDRKTEELDKLQTEITSLNKTSSLPKDTKLTLHTKTQILEIGNIAKMEELTESPIEYRLLYHLFSLLKDTKGFPVDLTELWEEMEEQAQWGDLTLEKQLQAKQMIWDAIKRINRRFAKAIKQKGSKLIHRVSGCLKINFRSVIH